MPEVLEQLRSHRTAAFADARLRIVVCGEFNTGKSSLINALVGLPDFLPTDVNPNTSYVTIVQTGDRRRFEVVRETGRQEITPDQFRALSCEQPSDLTIEQVIASAPEVWPGEPVVLVDTPGLEDLSETRAKITLDFLPKADVVVLVMDAVTGVKGTVRDFVRSVLTGTEQRRVVLVLNKADLLNDPHDVEKKLAACRAALVGVLPNAPWVVTCATARPGEPRGPAESGVPKLRETILRIAQGERLPLLAARFVRPASRTVAVIETRLTTEEAALDRPLAEVEGRIRDFRHQVAEAARKNDRAFLAARQTVEARLAPWFASLDRKLADFEQKAKAEVEALEDLEALQTYVETQALETKIALHLRKLADELSGNLAEALQAIERELLSKELSLPLSLDLGKSMGKVQTPLSMLPRPLVELLGVALIDIITPGGVLEAIVVRLGLGWLVKHVPKLQTLLPNRWIKDQLVKAVAKALEPVPEAVVSALHGAAREATGKILDELRDHLEKQIQAIEAGLQKASEELKAGQETVARRRKELAAAREGLKALSASLSDLASGAAATKA